MIDPLVEEYARTERARFEFRHFSLAPNDTTLAAIAAEAAGEQARQWQYLDTFVRNQELAISRDVDEDVLREIAEAVPQLEVDQWEEDFESPRSEELVREDAMLAAELELPAEPGGRRLRARRPARADRVADRGARSRRRSRRCRVSRLRRSRSPAAARRPCGAAGGSAAAARSARSRRSRGSGRWARAPRAGCRDRRRAP